MRDIRIGVTENDVIHFLKKPIILIFSYSNNSLILNHSLLINLWKRLIMFYVLIQIGLRGTGLAKGDIHWGRQQGWKVIQVCRKKSAYKSDQ